MEPILVEQRGQYLLSGPTVSICFISSTSIHLVPRVGVGYSYADFGETVETTEDAAQNVHAFITIFFEVFKQFEGRSLHLAGESYGVSGLFYIIWRHSDHVTF
jgi:hypothetical protein